MERLAKTEGFEGADWDESYVKQVNAQLDAKPISGIYGVIVLLDLEDPLVHKRPVNEATHENDAAFYMSLARANPDGSVSLEFPSQETIHFVDTFHLFSKPGDAMLVELAASPGSWFKEVSPHLIELQN